MTSTHKHHLLVEYYGFTNVDYDEMYVLLTKYYGPF